MTFSSRIVIAATAMLLAPATLAQPAPSKVAAQPQLRGLTAEEAAELIAKVADAQAKVKNKEQVVFELLSGAPAFYPMTRITPPQRFSSPAARQDIQRRAQGIG
ncbi:hypothetical protein [Sphingopyxis sp.]|uniref:hypothetical protein n=1 Tax=Sphingopyxis sp. TaxID=1908224 RepID=UPI003D0D1563